MIKIGRSYTTEILKAALAQSTLNKTQIEAILSANGLQGELLDTTTAEVANAASTNAVAASQETATSSTLGLSTAFQGLKVKINQVSTAAMEFLASNPFGWVVLGIGAVITATATIVKINKKIEEHREKIKEAGETTRRIIK